MFTPLGEVRALPQGATPIDFAYTIHTEVGHQCSGARVNGRITPLTRELHNGDTVEIITNPKQRPNRDWLKFVKTSRARTRIRQWIRHEEFGSALKIGKDFLKRTLKKAKLSMPDKQDELLAATTALGYRDFDQVYAALGRGDLGPTRVIKQLYPDYDSSQSSRESPTAWERLAKRLQISGQGVRIQGVDNLMVQYSRCCQPVPGDSVIGYITRGRGVSIHRNDCPNILQLSRDPERRVDIEWATEKDDRFFVKLYMRGTDRRGLLSDVAKAITNTGTNISNADMRTTDGGMSGEFLVEVRDLSHLEKVKRSIGSVKGVIDVERKEHFENEDFGWA